MASTFPTALDNLATNLVNGTLMITTHPTHHDDLASAINALESTTRGLVANVKWFGATGNGTTDDTAAINLAIAAAAASVFGTLYFPAGTYLISAPLTISSNILILGAGRWLTTILLANGTNSNVFVFTAGRTRCESLKIDGNSAGNPSVGYGIVGAVNDCQLTRVAVTGCNIGIGLGDTAAGVWVGATGNIYSLLDVTRNLTYGVQVNTDSELRGGFVGDNGSLASAYNRSNIFITGWNCRIDAVHIYGTSLLANTGTPGIFSNYANDVHIGGPTIIEEHPGPGMILRGRANGFTVNGVYFNDNSFGNSGAGAYDTVLYDIAVGETGQRNVFSGNRFGRKDTTSAVTNRYCINESARCDYNLYVGNQMHLGYVTSAFNLVGANSVQANNML